MSWSRLNDYAESMFRFEVLRPAWIDACALYLQRVFGGLEGKVFLDYAFGRGNWSVAAVKAGADRVIAVDAAIGNVRRFSELCNAEGLAGKIEVIHGNILEGPIPAANVLWIYGILHHIETPGEFLKRLSSLRGSRRDPALFYAYDRHSLREIIVTAARQAHKYETGDEFALASLAYTPAARLRARDDLTAPHIRWYGAEELAALLRSCDFEVTGDVGPFSPGVPGEFAPHHLLCGPGEARPLPEPRRPAAADFSPIAELAEHVNRTQGRNGSAIAVGLCNTHFSVLEATRSAEACIVQDWLYLYHAALRLDALNSVTSERLRAYLRATDCARHGTPVLLSGDILEQSPLARFLSENAVRF